MIEKRWHNFFNKKEPTTNANNLKRVLEVTFEGQTFEIVPTPAHAKYYHYWSFWPNSEVLFTADWNEVVYWVERNAYCIMYSKDYGRWLYPLGIMILRENENVFERAFPFHYGQGAHPKIELNSLRKKLEKHFVKSHCPTNKIYPIITVNNHNFSNPNIFLSNQ